MGPLQDNFFFIPRSFFQRDLPTTACSHHRCPKRQLSAMASELPRVGRVDVDPLSQAVVRQCLVVLLLVAALITIVPLAHGSPPDPTWIAGLYDDGDHDDAVLAIGSASGLPMREGAAISRARLASLRATCRSSTRLHTPAPMSPVDRAPPHP
jgi:hypothetical protein